MKEEECTIHTTILIGSSCNACDVVEHKMLNTPFIPLEIDTTLMDMTKGYRHVVKNSNNGV